MEYQLPAREGGGLSKERKRKRERKMARKRAYGEVFVLTESKLIKANQSIVDQPDGHMFAMRDTRTVYLIHLFTRRPNEAQPSLQPPSLQIYTPPSLPSIIYRNPKVSTSTRHHCPGATNSPRFCASCAHPPARASPPCASAYPFTRASSSGRKWRTRPWRGQAKASPRAVLFRKVSCLW